MHKFLGDFGYGQIALTKLWNDNQITIWLVKKEFYRHTKHIDIIYHNIKEKYDNCEITVAYTNTEN
jgi:hypothetical protein